jgi:hypothetical protein
MIRRHGLGVVCATVAELVSAFDDIARGSRPPTLDADARQLFELTSARPRLGELVDSVALP